jgi:saccharopine dehydrogenase-like NADP-dependent oxidoreductase
MRTVTVIGTGQVGSTIARLLAGSGDYAVTVADARPAALAGWDRVPGVSSRRIDAADPDELERACRGQDAVVSACSFDVNPAIAQAALHAGAHYFDLTEDVACTRAIRDLAQDAAPGQAFMPQCGLAPGFVSIAAHDLFGRFDRVDSLALRTGALPVYPNNELRYNLTWSTDGLINEYGNPCEAIVDGAMREVEALGGLEHFALDGVDYEAFNTSGGVGTLCDTLGGKVRNLSYKTLRYPGHRDLVAFLGRGLRLNERREVYRDLLEHAVPATTQDVVVIYCSAIGEIDGRLTQLTDARRVYHGSFRGEPGTAIQLSTAASLCAVLDLVMDGRVEVRPGLVRQEQVTLADFLSNRFGALYAAKDAWRPSVIETTTPPPARPTTVGTPPAA